MNRLQNSIIRDDIIEIDKYIIIKSLIDLMRSAGQLSDRVDMRASLFLKSVTNIDNN